MEQDDNDKNGVIVEKNISWKDKQANRRRGKERFSKIVKRWSRWIKCSWSLEKSKLLQEIEVIK